MRDLIKGKPCLLFYRGNYLRENMRREHVAEIELLAAMRNAGVATMDAVEAIVLEASSGLNVIRRGDGRGLSTLSDVDSDSDRG